MKNKTASIFYCGDKEKLDAWMGENDEALRNLRNSDEECRVISLSEFRNRGEIVLVKIKKVKKFGYEGRLNNESTTVLYKSKKDLRQALDILGYIERDGLIYRQGRSTVCGEVKRKAYYIDEVA